MKLNTKKNLINQIIMYIFVKNNINENNYKK